MEEDKASFPNLTLHWINLLKTLKGNLQTEDWKPWTVGLIERYKFFIFIFPLKHMLFGPPSRFLYAPSLFPKFAISIKR